MANSIGLIESKGLVALVEAADVILKNSPVKILGIKKLDNGLVSLAVLGDSEYVKAAIDSATDAGKRAGEIYAYSVVDDPDEELINLFSDLFNLEKEKVFEQKKSVGKSLVPKEVSTSPFISDKPSVIEDIKEIKPEGKRIIKKERLHRKEIIKDKPEFIVEKKIKSESKLELEHDTPSKKTLSTIERLRKEALGLSAKSSDKEIIVPKKKEEKKLIFPAASKIDFEAINQMNVHKLRHYARTFENFPIKGREISRANRDELVELFKSLE